MSTSKTTLHKNQFLTVATALLLSFSLLVTASESTTSAGANILNHTVKDIDGNEIDLEQYKGKVILLVNVASKCGLTPQYADLMEIHNKYASKGLAILGFPANNFRNQEPGSNAEIKEFCSSNYNVAFDLFSKISVAGEDKAPLYKVLTSNELNGEFGGEIKWNFTKFLADKDGNIIARFEPRTKPTDETVITAIEAALNK